ncbi:hypothetical protein PG989_012083 [Apiospora arundinis]|uniref:Uncharacterized protein n=1 Tax=Apiospora arundinis TaxID=335852 RepID=A0ABR2IIQ6_9PEZI
MSVSTEETPYLALVVLKVAELTGLRIAWRNPPPALVIPVVPGVTSKGAFVREIVRQAASASKAPDHIINMPRGLGDNGLPLETVVASTAKDVQIVWTISAPPPSGFGGNGRSSALASTNPFFEKDGASSTTNFQAVTSLADLSDTQFHDCIRKMQSRETNRGREDYFVMEVKYDYDQQKQKQKQRQMEEDDEFMPLPPIAVSTTREDFLSPEKKKQFDLPLPLPPSHHPHSEQYEQEQKNIRMLTAASSSGLMGPPSFSNYEIVYPPSRSRPVFLPTVEEESEDDGQPERTAGEYGLERSPRATKINKGKNVAAALHQPLPKTPVGSPRHRHRHGLKVPASIKGHLNAPRKPEYTPSFSPIVNDKDDRPETYTPDVWGINKTILDTRIADHEKETSPDEEFLQRRRSPTRGSNSKSRIPGLAFHLPLSRGLKKSASSPSLVDDHKKGGFSSASSRHQLNAEFPIANRKNEN